MPNLPVARIAIGSLDPGERREVSTSIPAKALSRLTKMPVFDPGSFDFDVDAMVDALLEGIRKYNQGTVATKTL